MNELTTERTVFMTVDGERRGYAAFVENENRVRMIYIYVPEEYRSLGYGHKLVMFLVEEAEKLGVPLHTGRMTSPGISLLEGMRQEGLIELKELEGASYLEYEVRRTT